MTSAAWLAVGATIASLLGGSVHPAAILLIASAAGVGAAGWWSGSVRESPSAAPADRRRGRHLRAIAAVTIGALAIGLRLVVAADPDPGSRPLPEGSGAWQGTVLAVSSPRDGAQVATLGLHVAASPAGESRVVDVAATLPRFPTVVPGDLVEVDGRLESPPDGPYGEYLARIGVEATVFSRQLEVTGRDDGPGARLEGLRRGAGDALAAAIPEPEAGLAAGIVIGLRDRVDRDLAAAFTTVGASHVVAISGWNIAIVAATIGAVAGSLGRRRRALVLVVAIVAYVLVAGGSASVVRAAVMAGVVLLARETGRAGRASAALGWAAALLLLADPALVTDPGFQLSTLATGGILAWANPWTERIGALAGGRVPRWLAESLGVSLAAQAATLPVVLVTFGRLALVSPIVNLAIVPLVAPAMAAALIALLGGAVTLAGGPAAVATLAGLPAWALLTAMCTIIRAAAALPFASATIEPPWTLAAGSVVALVILAGPSVWRHARDARRRRAGPSGRATSAAPVPPRAGDGPRRRRSRLDRVALVAIVAATAGLGLAFAHRVDGATRITVLDVGQGDSILVEGGRGGRMLIDAGPDPDRLLVELDRRLPPWDRRIDILILTHPHEDHVAGMPLLLERYRIGRIYETGMRGPGPGYAAFARELAARNAPPHALLATGARIALDDIRFQVLWPDPERVPREPPDAGRGINDVSIVLLGEVGGRRFLLTGDVEDDVDPLLASRGIPPVDILKVAHHGSATASTPAFLDEVRPKVAVVSAGAGNPYGHPARSTIDRLNGTGARVLRTDTDGSVQITIEPDGAIGVAASGARKAAAIAPAATPDAALAAFRTPPVILRSRSAFACGIPSTG